MKTGVARINKALSAFKRQKDALIKGVTEVDELIKEKEDIIKEESDTIEFLSGYRSSAVKSIEKIKEILI